MKNLSMKSPPLYCEFTRASLKLLAGGERAEFPLERLADGQLTAPCRARLVIALKQFSRSAALPSQAPAWCALDARVRAGDCERTRSDDPSR